MSNTFYNQVFDGLSSEKQLIVAACSPNLDVGIIQRIIDEIENWEETCDKLIKKGVAPLLLDVLEKHPELIVNSQQQYGFKNIGIPREVVGKLKQAHFKTITRSLILFDVFREIAEALNQKGIKAVALKGIYLAEHIYSQIGLRQFSDIDLLFHKENVPEVLKILKALGFTDEEQPFNDYVNSTFERAHLPHLVRRGVSVEVHTRLHDAFNEYDLPENEMFDRAVPVMINQTPFYALELHDMLIHLCIHLEKHLHTNHMQFYSIADIARVFHIYMNEIDTDILLERCQAYSAQKEVFGICQLVASLTGISIGRLSSQSVSDKYFSSLIEKINDHLEGKIRLKVPSTQVHIKYFNKIGSKKAKLRYLLGIVFPSKNTLIKIYQIKNTRLFWIWYFVRWGKGLKGILVKR